MDKREALAIFTREFVRELLRDDEELPAPSVPFLRPVDEPPTMATPQFDFDEPPPTEAELDEAVEDFGGAAAARARRRAEILAARRAERLFPEDLPMSGLGPPEDLP